ncbi:MAG TPA: class I mannose-6-phosphate isomerase, partial [Chitinophagaceae bacterium]|nr:class I mannose-6-phosphate isomerase [Chitinophagaceae bacterium]
EKMSNKRLVVIDGYGGVLWENFREHLQLHLFQKRKKIFWYDIDACLKSQEEIDAMISHSLNGDDPVFGNKYRGNLSDFFDAHKISMIVPDADADICIIYGTGASLADWNGMHIYIDVPKNEIQYRIRAGTIYNIGADRLFSNTQMYKRSYFVDWPVLNKHKERLLSKIEIIVDEQRINEITWMDGHDFRNTLKEMATHPFRSRPWFEAGVWGGNWMKKNIAGLNKDEINYAWSFELITPENGIVIEGNSYLMEVSFDFLLFSDNRKLLGNAAERFGMEFPIRFDFLDTYEGGNLSIQCHPRTDYIIEKFGESFTQDETYYILDCEPDAKVYLGFQEEINEDEFKTALLNAQQNNIELPIEKYVQKHDAQKHDLFLIPNGTIHAAGKNNLVLEISSTPYIFTFKMYDWLRLDLNGQPRPINIEHAFNNLYFDRKGEKVSSELISNPQIEKEWDNGRKVKLPTHPVHFYTVDRYEFTGSIQINTYNQCHICMLVQGDCIEVVANRNSQSFYYAETFIIPAAVKHYELINKGTDPAFVVIAYVKEE